jgi:polyisoprenoid-binding protein YceI
MTTATWNIDAAHSGIHFTVRHMVVARLHGQFRRWSAEIAIDETDLTRSSVGVTIEAASVDTGNAQRDADLRSGNFFDVERFPALTFRSRRIERTGKDGYSLVGDLTIRDVTREIALDAELGGFLVDPWGMRRAGFTARANVRRSDFGMIWNQFLEAGGVAVGDDVAIAIEVEAVSKAQAVSQAPQTAVA